MLGLKQESSFPVFFIQTYNKCVHRENVRHTVFFLEAVQSFRTVNSLGRLSASLIEEVIRSHPAVVLLCAAKSEFCSVHFFFFWSRRPLYIPECLPCGLSFVFCLFLFSPECLSARPYCSPLKQTFEQGTPCTKYCGKPDTDITWSWWSNGYLTVGDCGQKGGV